MPALMQCVMNVLVCVYMFLEFLNDFFFLICNIYSILKSARNH